MTGAERATLALAVAVATFAASGVIYLLLAVHAVLSGPALYRPEVRIVPPASSPIPAATSRPVPSTVQA